MGHNIKETIRNDKFIKKVKKSFDHDKASFVIIAYDFACKRLSNEDIPLSVADLLLNQGADDVTIASSFLAPVLWHNCSDIKEIREAFGEVIASTLCEFKSPTAIRTDTESHRREDIQILLNSLTGDNRSIVLRIAFRLIELESPSVSNREELRKIARETLDLYVPLANRLGLGELRKRLEDVSFLIEDPSAYHEIKQKVAPIQAEDDRCLKILIEGINRILKKKDIEGNVQGRTKSLYSIYCKMARLGADFHEIMDRIGIRIIVSSVPECYKVLGILHSHFKPIPGTFDDYIGLPKNNGYQSLHTCVYPVREVSHKPIEFQIRTELMHMEAEYGIAAHWRYKSSEAFAIDDNLQSQWMKSLVLQHKDSDSAESFFKLLYQQIYEDHVVVFGNAGQIVRLPENANVRDYVKRFNEKIPPLLQVKVNGKITELDHRLHDGDTVEIIDGENPAFNIQKDKIFL